MIEAGNVLFVVNRPMLPGEPPQVCPDVLTGEEACRYLRLDTMQLDDPLRTLERLRSKGGLVGVQISKRVFYRLPDLEAFLAAQAGDNPR